MGDYDTYRVRDPFDIVHWTEEPGTRAGIYTQCGRSLANLYELHDPRAWDEQFLLDPFLPVTCLECLLEGPRQIVEEEAFYRCSCGELDCGDCDYVQHRKEAVEDGRI
jgi:hypothetical protein